MERLTKRDRKGCAYFDDDGALIRGASGTFRQKKDMTARYIHDRFVALDKTIDRLAAYEDIGLEPEEIMALIQQQPNDPLNLEELREMYGEPVWIEFINNRAKSRYRIIHVLSDISIIFKEYNKEFGPYDHLFLGHYGKTWLAYRRKPEGAKRPEAVRKRREKEKPKRLGF